MHIYISWFAVFIIIPWLPAMEYDCSHHTWTFFPFSQLQYMITAIFLWIISISIMFMSIWLCKNYSQLNHIGNYNLFFFWKLFTCPGANCLVLSFVYFFHVLITSLILNFFFTSFLNLKVFRCTDFIFLMKYLPDSSDRLSFSHYVRYTAAAFDFPFPIILGLLLHSSGHISCPVFLVFYFLVLISCFSEVSITVEWSRWAV